MQIFMPYGDKHSFEDSLLLTANSLDNKRLGCQRKEANQIIDIINGKYSSWKNHPAVKMIGPSYITFLKFYKNVIMKVWEERGFRNIKLQYEEVTTVNIPIWYGDEKLHSSHRAALLYKNYDYYKQFGWREKPELNYYWPKLVD